MLDVSCLDEEVDCEFQTSHEHVDLDQGEAKDRLRTAGDVSDSARDQLQFFSHVDTPVVHELDRDERLIFCEDNSVISHKQQDNSSGLCLKMTAAPSHSSNRTTAPHQQSSVLYLKMTAATPSNRSSTPAVERLVHEHGREQLSVVLAWRISLMRLRLAAWIAQRGEVFLE